MKYIVTTAIAALFAIACSTAKEVGKTAPEFTGKTLTGEEVSLSDFEGKVVVLEWVNFDGTIGKAYDAKVTPHMYVISKDGNLVYNGAMDSIGSTKADDIEKAEPWLATAIDAALAGEEVQNATNKPYGCGVKY